MSFAKKSEAIFWGNGKKYTNKKYNDKKDALNDIGKMVKLGFLMFGESGMIDECRMLWMIKNFL